MAPNINAAEICFGIWSTVEAENTFVVFNAFITERR